MMILLEKICKVTAVHKKSASEAFKGLSVGDLIHFSIPVCAVGSGGRGTYAAYVCCKNLQTGKESHLSFNQIGRTLDNFEWAEQKAKSDIKFGSCWDCIHNSPNDYNKYCLACLNNGKKNWEAK